MNAPALDRHLAGALQAIQAGPIAVGLSGGCDSSVLLHALAHNQAARERGLRAIHVDHGLHPDSALWAEQAVALARSLDVDCIVLPVAVERRSGSGPEAAARAARYAAWSLQLRPGEILALGHHRDDQVETVLLKLLRGAGGEGLGAMRPWRALASGWLWRPLLDLPREALAAHAAEHRLTWIDDPSNTDQRMDRNYLRHRVLPLLRERWPRSDAVIARSAEWLRASADYLDTRVERAAAQLIGLDPATLRIAGWLALPDALRDPVLRHWLRALDLAQPSHLQAAELLRQMQTAEPDSTPLLRWPGAELRRYRDLLHAMPPRPLIDDGWSCAFDGSVVELPAGLGSLLLDGQPSADSNAMTVRFRRRGERIQLPGETHHRELRDLFQQNGIPPWQRDRLPMVIAGDGELLAVADLWLSHRADAEWTSAKRRLRWMR